MKLLKPTVSDARSLKYLRGWGYHCQLGSLDTNAPHVLPSQKTFPAGVEDIREMEITRGGFQPSKNHASCYLYRAHPGPSWSKDGARALPASEFAPFQVTGSATPLAPTEKLIPRKFKPLPPNQSDIFQSLKTLFYNQDLSVGVTTGNQPMQAFFRNADGDDLFYVHEGTGFCETELGVLGYETGHFVWVPKGIAYRIVPTSDKHQLLHVETYSDAFGKPDTGLTGDAAIYHHRNIEVPMAHFSLQKGEFDVVVKSRGYYTVYRQTHHPMDVVGWDGTLFPFRLHIRDILPITSWRAHIPPSAYCVFCGGGFEICAFVPRPVETGERALPVPFDHINIDRDEVIFYSKGVFFSKDTSAEGSLTFHPRGVSHGPHPDALRVANEKREKQGMYFFEGYFIMVETFKELFPTKFSLEIEDPSYINSWL